MRGSRADLRAGATGLACHAAVVLAVASSLSAQTVPESTPLFAPPDRQLLGMLDSSRELLDQRRYSEAVGLLATIRLVKVAAAAGPLCSQNRSGDRRSPIASNRRWRYRLSGTSSFGVRR